MTLVNFMKLYLVALPVFFIIDMIWLGLIAKGFYQKHLGFLMRPQVNWIPAILFYLIFIAGILIFVVIPAKADGSAVKAVWLGLIFGLVTYATYDLTNLATVKQWPLVVTVVDITWGMILSASVGFLTYMISKALKF
ncbi:MAG: DUF2177 family protein [Candidatus Aminicenantes bacterium]